MKKDFGINKKVSVCLLVCNQKQCYNSRYCTFTKPSSKLMSMYLLKLEIDRKGVQVVLLPETGAHWLRRTSIQQLL